MHFAALMFVTDFADQAVILPVVAVVFLILLAQRRWQVASAWMLAIPGVLGTLLVLKVACYACGWLLPALGLDQLALRSPSGHVASAAVVSSGVVALQAGRMRVGAIPAALTAALAAAVVIGVTRVLLGAHSMAEVVVAAAIGGAGAVAFARLSGRHLKEKSGLPIAMAAAIMLVVFHGSHLPAEAVIQSAAAATLRQWVPACQPD
ncbi:MAG TPA: phosphatase PAP2 family protein [Acetobacteraceae bacterium]